MAKIVFEIKRRRGGMVDDYSSEVWISGLLCDMTMSSMVRIARYHARCGSTSRWPSGVPTL